MTAPKVCPKICRECPFRRASAPGWLGSASHDPQGFIGPHWYGQTRLPCHMTVDWQGADPQARAMEAPLCRGFLTMAKQAVKRLDNTEMEDARQGMTPDPDVFGWLHEFVEHHRRK